MSDLKSPARAEAWPQSLAEHLAERHKHLMLETEREAFQAAQSGDKARQSIASTESERHRAVYHAMCLIIADEAKRSASPSAEECAAREGSASEIGSSGDTGRNLAFPGKDDRYLSPSSQAEALQAGVDAVRVAAFVRTWLEDWGIDLQHTCDSYRDAMVSGRHNGRKIPNDMARKFAAEFKERADAVYPLGELLEKDVLALLSSAPAQEDGSKDLSAHPRGSGPGPSSERIGVLIRMCENARGNLTQGNISAEGMLTAVVDGLGGIEHVARQALEALSPMQSELHGPFGHLVIPLGLDEEHWRIEDAPVNDTDHVSLPMFTKVDPFKVALSDAGSDAEGRG